jgi:hypothetical protein
LSNSLAAVSFHISVWMFPSSGPTIGVVQYPVTLVYWLAFLNQKTTVATLRLKNMVWGNKHCFHGALCQDDAGSVWCDTWESVANVWHWSPGILIFYLHNGCHSTKGHSSRWVL